MAKKENMPKDTIDRAVKKGTDAGTTALDSITYEAYGPGGCALIIEVLTDNKNRAAAEVRHSLSKSGYELATPGAAAWAFERNNMEWAPTTTIGLSESDGDKLGDIIDNLEDLDDVQNIYTNAE
jgi:transcriptional/translational regulatory protein YebC/TACO1